jgi:hypothetical protein
MKAAPIREEIPGNPEHPLFEIQKSEEEIESKDRKIRKDVVRLD